MGEHRLSLGPARDALPQGAALVPPRLTRSQAGVHVHVRLDVRRAEHGPAHVDLLGHVVDPDSSPLHRGETALVDEQVDQPLRRSARDGQPAVADHKLHHTPSFAGIGSELGKNGRCLPGRTLTRWTQPAMTEPANKVRSVPPTALATGPCSQPRRISSQTKPCERPVAPQIDQSDAPVMPIGLPLAASDGPASWSLLTESRVVPVATRRMQP